VLRLSLSLVAAILPGLRLTLDRPPLSNPHHDTSERPIHSPQC